MSIRGCTRQSSEDIYDLVLSPSIVPRKTLSPVGKFVRRALSSLALGILISHFSLLFLVTPQIRAGAPPEVSRRLVKSLDSTKNDVKSLPPDGRRGRQLFAVASNIAVTVTVTSLATGILPNTYSLSQNYPNPFNASTVIEYTLPEPAWVTLEVYNALGQRVTTLINENKFAGEHSVRWDAGYLASGVYFYRMTAGNFLKSRKMVLLK